MSRSSNRLKDVTSVITPPEVTEELPPEATKPEVEEAISESEAAGLRQEKLAAIKRAVENGAYDSDELLEKALQRLKRSIESENGRQ